MLAARWWGRRDVRVEDIADPGDPPAGWVRVKVEACGICGTDMEEYREGPVLVPIEPHPLTGRCAPLTLGHEAVGVVDVGSGSLEAGTRVAIETNVSCGTCWWCLRGQIQLCPELACLGLMGDGGLAEIFLTPAAICAPFSTDVRPDRAALAEPLSVAVRAVRKGGVGLGSTVGIIGAGTVGLLILQVALHSGASRVIVVDPLASRRALALKLGADAAVAPDDAAEAALELTHGVGPDVTFEAGGNPKAARAAVQLVRKGGRAILLGVFNSNIELGMIDVLFGEKHVEGSLSHVFTTDFVPAVELIDRKAIDLDALITDRIPLVDVVERGFLALANEPEQHLKIVVYPDPTMIDRP
jgi:(R,R)-butanediol dehydrogenase/meso-butanediol dehydrogenase/diacetyl reductase